MTGDEKAKILERVLRKYHVQRRISTCVPRGHPNREEEAGALDAGLVSQPSAALKDTIKHGGKNKTWIRPAFEIPRQTLTPVSNNKAVVKATTSQLAE